MAEEYITQVSEEIEVRVTRKLTEESSRTELRVLGALSKLDECLLSPQVCICYKAVGTTNCTEVMRKAGHFRLMGKIFRLR